MTRLLLILFMLCAYYRVEAQNLKDHVDKKWFFSFMMIPGNKKSISTDYHATTFEITSDSTFTMGLSEAVESGSIHPDSTLTVKLYDYNSDKSTQAWAKSFKIVHYSNDYLVLMQSRVNYNNYLHNYKGIGSLLYIYSRNQAEMRTVSAKKNFKKLKKEYSIN